MEALYLKSTEVQQIQHLSLKFKPPINYWNTLLKEKKQRNHVQNLWSTKMLHHASEVKYKMQFTFLTQIEDYSEPSGLPSYSVSIQFCASVTYPHYILCQMQNT